MSAGQWEIEIEREASLYQQEKAFHLWMLNFIDQKVCYPGFSCPWKPHARKEVGVDILGLLLFLYNSRRLSPALFCYTANKNRIKFASKLENLVTLRMMNCYREEFQGPSKCLRVQNVMGEILHFKIVQLCLLLFVH